MRKEFVCCIIEHTIKRSSVREESIIPAFSCCVCVCLFMLRGMIWRFGAPWMKVDLFKKSVSYACPWSRGRYNHSWDKTNEGLSSSWRITRQFNAARLDYWYWLMDDFNTNRYVYDFIWIYARRNARLADAVAGWSCKLLQAMNCLLPLHTYCTKSIQYQPVTNLLQHYFTWTEIQIDTFKTSETGKWNFYASRVKSRAVLFIYIAAESNGSFDIVELPACDDKEQARKCDSFWTSLPRRLL